MVIMDRDSSHSHGATEPPSKRRRVGSATEAGEDSTGRGLQSGSEEEGDNSSSGDDEEEEEEEDDEEEEDEGSGDDNDGFDSQKKQLNEDEEFELSYKYRQLDKDLAEQRSQLTTENGISIVKKTLSVAEELFEGMKTSSNTMILAKDSATLKEIGEQAKIATQNVKFGQSGKLLKFETFVSSWMSCFGTIRQQRGLTTVDTESNDIPENNWSNAGLLFNSISKHVMGCDFLLGPLEIERKKRVVRQRLVDDSRRNATKTANLKNADDVVNKDTKDDTSKAAERLYKRLQQYGQKISLFEAVLHPTSFGKTIECMFVCSFLINNGHLIMDKYENGIPYLELASRDNVKLQQRYKDNDDGKSHIIFSLDEDTWRQLVEVYQISEPFFTNSEE